jgi:hypothetical protein
MRKATRWRNAGSRIAQLRWQAWLIVAGLPAALAVLALVTPEQLEELPGLCLWSRVTGEPCLGCGTLRAGCCLAHGELGRAVSYNRNVLVLAPLVAWIWLGQVCLLRRVRHEAVPITSPQ